MSDRGVDSLVLFGAVVYYFFLAISAQEAKILFIGYRDSFVALLVIVSIRLLVSDWISPVSDGDPPTY